MKLINYLILLLTLTIFANGCSGYKPIFNSNNLNFKISSYSIKGDKTLGNQLYSKMKKSSTTNESQEAKNLSILINVSKLKEATVKNSSGKILEYKITLNTIFEAKNYLTEKIIINNKFSYSTSYKIQNKYFDTIKLEKKTIENLINKTHQELLIKLSEIQM
jgi:hypothetical protein